MPSPKDFDATRIKPEDRDLAESLVIDEGCTLNRRVEIGVTGYETDYAKK